MIKLVLKPGVFFGLLFTLFLLCGLWLYDLTSGDANGIVAGISIKPIITFLSILLNVHVLLMAFVAKNKAAQNTLLSIISIAVTFFILEWFSGKWIAFQQMNKPQIEGPKHSFQPDDILGYKPAPNQAIKGVKSIDRRKIYDISFQTDENSLRKIDLNFASATRYAQFYGCSMMFGEGVNSNETIPYLFAEKDSTYHAYNFAFSGYGPTQMLARLQTENLSEIVKEESGFGVYIYIPDHVNRVINTYTNYSYNHGNVPKYVLNNDQLIREGTYDTSSKLRNFFFDLMAKSNILKVFNVGYPFKITAQDYNLTAEVLLQSTKEFEQKFQSKRFYIVIYPSNADNSAMVDLLRSKGLKVLDYSKLFDPSVEGLAIPNDEHPTPKANRLLVEKLFQDIAATD